MSLHEFQEPSAEHGDVLSNTPVEIEASCDCICADHGNKRDDLPGELLKHSVNRQSMLDRFDSDALSEQVGIHT